MSPVVTRVALSVAATLLALCAHGSELRSEVRERLALVEGELVRLGLGKLD